MSDRMDLDREDTFALEALEATMPLECICTLLDLRRRECSV